MLWPLQKSLRDRDLLTALLASSIALGGSKDNRGQ